jgi:hypothetical protein
MRADVGKIRDISGFHGSLELLRQQELEQTGFSAGGQAVIRDLERMFKALPPEAIEAPAKLAAQRLADRAKKPAPRFSKALGDLGAMVKAIPQTAARVAGIKVAPPEPTEAELVAKATGHLLFNDQLNAAERGALLLGISAAHDRSFAKAQRAEQPHPVAGQIEAIKAALIKARDERDLSGPAATYLAEALRHIEQGITDADDRNRLMALLQQLKLALAAGDSDALGAGDAQ